MPFHFLELIFPLLIVFCVVIALIITIARLRLRQEHYQQPENMFQTYQHGYQQLRQSSTGKLAEYKGYRYSCTLNDRFTTKNIRIRDNTWIKFD